MLYGVHFFGLDGHFLKFRKSVLGLKVRLSGKTGFRVGVSVEILLHWRVDRDINRNILGLDTFSL